MVPLPTFPDALAWLALCLLMAAALTDLAWRRIPNGIAALLALVGLARQGVGGAFGVALLAGALVFLGCLLLWQRGALGGGDVKLLAAASLLVPPALVPAQLLAVALAG
ncbi:MAG TPA: A24 family peptidase, partial [Roseomonas sp.]|nr:A24 family peptidase [Roseomonas sp.]